MTLDGIYKLLKAIPEYPTEDGHTEADDLLIETIKVLREMLSKKKQNEVTCDIDNIMFAYNQIRKWYA